MVEKNSQVSELSKKNFNEFIKSGKVLIDFYADWCMPCIMMAPILEETSSKFKGKVKFGKINTEDYPELAQKFDIVSIPNFILFEEGKPKEQIIGSMTAEEFEKKLNGFV
ncbi:MAG: thioredoxin [Candidatus Pacearchaeota archaeon]